MSACQSQDCGREATHYLHIAVAPYGYPIARGVKMSLGLELCLRCAEGTKASDLFDVDLKQKLREVVRILHRSSVPLDFTRTKIEARPIGDAEWKLLKGAAK